MLGKHYSWKQPRVGWFKLIWGPFLIPRHSFIAWTAVHDILATEDRQASWDANVDPICMLCGNANKSRNPLFFNCHHSKMVWGSILSLSNVHRCVGGWQTKFDWASKNLEKQSFLSSPFQIAWCACVDHL